jgi:hypothetical protein
MMIDSETELDEFVEWYGDRMPNTETHREWARMAWNACVLREVVPWVEDYIVTNGHLETDGERKGWIDTMALTSVKNAGDYLCNLGLWERHEDGVGRRWWYRKRT